MKAWIFPLMFLVLVNVCLAATIHGTVYDENLDVLKNAIVEVGSTPQQRFVAKEGTYKFTLPEGSYTLTTKYNDQIAKEKITIEAEGDYVLDLFLFPSFEEEEELLEEIEEISVEDEYFEEEKISKTTLTIISIMIVLVLTAVIFYSLKSKKPKVKAGIEDIKEDDETKKYLEFIKKEGGRTTQKEIRKNFPMSEAKISLIITELEHKGKVQKIRKGRSNVVILKK